MHTPELLQLFKDMPSVFLVRLEIYGLFTVGLFYVQYRDTDDIYLVVINKVYAPLWCYNIVMYTASLTHS